MAHTFDGSGFGQLLLEAERLLSGARDYEQRLASLVAILEGESAHVAISATPIETTVGLLAIVGQLRDVAGEHRELAERLLTRLVGQRAVSDGALPPRACVLVVDDSESSRDMTATVLEEAGFETITATNGLEGLVVAHYARPAAVLMDVTMPVLDGVEAARLIRASAVTRDVKVIAYTAKPDIRDAAFARWFVDVLRKPAAPDAIVAAVQRSVDGSRSEMSPIN
jgi:CheY-like chemotaxis protein